MNLRAKKGKVSFMIKEEKQKIIKEFATKENDTGSIEVQVAILTNRINNLNRSTSLDEISTKGRRY